jgi:hypothetical protein
VTDDPKGASFTLVEPDVSEGGALPAIDFSTFVLSLGTSALHQLGLTDGPEGRRAETPNLALARQTIETLQMLAEKTRGNLATEEDKLLDSVLYELRVKFVEAKG